MSAVVVYSSAARLRAELSETAARLDAGTDTSPTAQSRLRAGISDLQRAVADLESLGRREVTAAKRETTLGRAAKLREECAQIQASLDRFKVAEQARIAEEQRQALLGREHALSQRGPGGTPTPTKDSTILTLESSLLHERDVLDASSASIDNYLTIGRTALQELYDQRSMLKSTQKRLLDAANTLGLSSAVIRFIEQRTAMDRWILYGGIFVSVVAMWGIVHYFG